MSWKRLNKAFSVWLTITCWHQINAVSFKKHNSELEKRVFLLVFAKLYNWITFIIWGQLFLQLDVFNESWAKVNALFYVLKNLRQTAVRFTCHKMLRVMLCSKWFTVTFKNYNYKKTTFNYTLHSIHNF